MSLPVRACPIAAPRRGRLTLQPPDAETAARSPHGAAAPSLSIDAEGGALLALDLGQKTGWAVRNADGAIASGTVEFKPGRFEGGGMAFLRFRAWALEHGAGP